jgi:hypothetical protein
MIYVITAILVALAIALPVVVVVLPFVVIGQLFGFRSSNTPTQRIRPLEDEIIKAQWRYDNIWRRRDK